MKVKNEMCHCARTSRYHTQDSTYKNHTVKRCWTDLKPKPSNKGKSGVRIPENITVICVCGKVFTTAIDTREEDGFKCDCGVPIISPLNEEEEVK